MTNELEKPSKIHADEYWVQTAEIAWFAHRVRPGRKPGTRVISVKDGTCGVPTLLIEPVKEP